MKKFTGLFVAAAAGIAAIAGCGRTSPVVSIVCSTSAEISAGGPAPAIFKIVQTVNYLDPGLPGPAEPANGIKLRIISAFPDNAAVCDGTCALSDTFSADTKVTTDGNGIAIFTVRLQGTPATGFLLELADSQTAGNCQVPFTVN